MSIKHIWNRHVRSESQYQSLSYKFRRTTTDHSYQNCHFLNASCGLGTEKQKKEYEITTELYLLSCLLCPAQRVCWHQSYAPMQPLERWAAADGWSLWSSDLIKSSGNDPLRVQGQLRTEESMAVRSDNCLLPAQAINRIYIQKVFT